MNSSCDYGDYIVIKISPFVRGCCCFHCWPQTWETVNRYIHPFGPLKDEGDVLIIKDNEKFVLECHESGPELVVLASKILSLVTVVVNLIVALLKARQDDHNKPTAKFKITKSYQIGAEIKEEQIMELTLPLSKDSIEKLERNLSSLVKKKKSKKTDSR